MSLKLQGGYNPEVFAGRRVQDVRKEVVNENANSVTQGYGSDNDSRFHVRAEYGHCGRTESRARLR